MTCGSANIYTAFSNPYPSQSFYEESGTVSSGNPGLMFVNSSYDRTLFINLVDAMKSNGGSGDCQICINPKDGDHRDHGKLVGFSCFYVDRIIIILNVSIFNEFFVFFIYIFLYFTSK